MTSKPTFIKRLCSINSIQELTILLEELIESHNYPTWCPLASDALQSWTVLIVQEGNVICGVLLARLLMGYIELLEENELVTVLPVLMQLDNLVDLTSKWKSDDEAVNISFWEAVNDLQIGLYRKHPKCFTDYVLPLQISLYRTCTDATVSLFLRQIRLKTLNFLLESCSDEVKVLFRSANDNCIIYLLKALEEIGDYDCQTGFLEAVFRLTSASERNGNVSKWFPSLDYKLQHLFVRIRDFDPDCRKFLNAYNAQLGDKRGVYTLPCVEAKLGHFYLQKPNIHTYKHLWVDFNLGSMAVSLLFDRSDPNVTTTEREWETVIVYRHEVETAILMTTIHGRILNLKLNSEPENFFASPPSQAVMDLITNEFTLEFNETFTDLRKLCSIIFKDKLHILAQAAVSLSKYLPSQRRTGGKVKKSATLCCITTGSASDSHEEQSEENVKNMEDVPDIDRRCSKASGEHTTAPKQLQSCRASHTIQAVSYMQDAVTETSDAAASFSGEQNDDSGKTEGSEEIIPSSYLSGTHVKLCNLLEEKTLLKEQKEVEKHKKNSPNGTATVLQHEIDQNKTPVAKGRVLASFGSNLSSTSSICPMTKTPGSSASGPLDSFAKKFGIQSKLKHMLNFSERRETSKKKKKSLAECREKITEIECDSVCVHVGSDADSDESIPTVVHKTQENDILDVDSEDDIIPSSLVTDGYKTPTISAGKNLISFLSSKAPASKKKLSVLVQGTEETTFAVPLAGNVNKTNIIWETPDEVVDNVKAVNTIADLPDNAADHESVMKTYSNGDNEELTINGPETNDQSLSLNGQGGTSENWKDNIYQSNATANEKIIEYNESLQIGPVNKAETGQQDMVCINQTGKQIKKVGGRSKTEYYTNCTYVQKGKGTSAPIQIDLKHGGGYEFLSHDHDTENSYLLTDSSGTAFKKSEEAASYIAITDQCDVNKDNIVSSDKVVDNVTSISLLEPLTERRSVNTPSNCLNDIHQIQCSNTEQDKFPVGSSNEDIVTPKSQSSAAGTRDIEEVGEDKAIHCKQSDISERCEQNKAATEYITENMYELITSNEVVGKAVQSAEIGSRHKILGSNSADTQKHDMNLYQTEAVRDAEIKLCTVTEPRLYSPDEAQGSSAIDRNEEDVGKFSYALISPVRSTVSCKPDDYFKSADHVLSSAHKMLSDYPVQPHGLKTPCKLSESGTDESGSRNINKRKYAKLDAVYSSGANKRRNKGKSLPSHYIASITPAKSRVSSKQAVSNSSTKKKLFDSKQSTMLEDSPPVSCHEDLSGHEKAKSKSSDMEVKGQTSKSRESGYLVNGTVNSSQSENSQNKFFKRRMKPEHLKSPMEDKKKGMHETVYNKRDSNITNRVLTPFSTPSPFSVYDVFDDSDPQNWLQRKEKSRIQPTRTYGGRKRSSTYVVGSDSSDSEWSVRVQKSKKKKVVKKKSPQRPYTADDSDSQGKDGSVLFKNLKSKKKKKKSPPKPSKIFYTRSVAKKQQKLEYEQSVVEERAAKKNPKRSYVETITPQLSSPEIMRNTSLQQQSSFEDIPDVVIQSPKSNNKSDVLSNQKGKGKNSLQKRSTNFSKHRKMSPEISQMKSVLQIILPDESDKNASMDKNSLSLTEKSDPLFPPSPPNNTPVEKYDHLLNTSQAFEVNDHINFIAHDKSGNDDGPLQSTLLGEIDSHQTAARFSYVSEMEKTYDDTTASAQEKKQTAPKKRIPDHSSASELSPAFNKGLSCSLNLDNSDSYTDYFQRQSEIPIHPNSDYSSEDNIQNGTGNTDRIHTEHPSHILTPNEVTNEENLHQLEPEKSFRSSGSLVPETGFQPVSSQESVTDVCPPSFLTVLHTENNERLNSVTDSQQMAASSIQHGMKRTADDLLLTLSSLKASRATPLNKYAQESLETPAKAIPRKLFEAQTTHHSSVSASDSAGISRSDMSYKEVTLSTDVLNYLYEQIKHLEHHATQVTRRTFLVSEILANILTRSDQNEGI